MNAENKFALIDGTFTPEEAREILMSLVGSNIQFHNLRNFSLQVRKGVKDEYSLKKKEELEQIRKQILDRISTLEADMRSIEIQCSVNIRIK